MRCSTLDKANDVCKHMYIACIYVLNLCMLNMIPLNDESDHAVCGGEWRCSTLDKPLILDPAQTPNSTLNSIIKPVLIYRWSMVIKKKHFYVDKFWPFLCYLVITDMET